jgi:hypothetical protein
MSREQLPAVQKFLLHAFGVPHTAMTDWRGTLVIYDFPKGAIWVLGDAEKIDISVGLFE